MTQIPPQYPSPALGPSMPPSRGPQQAGWAPSPGGPPPGPPQPPWGLASGGPPGGMPPAGPKGQGSGSGLKIVLVLLVVAAVGIGGLVLLSGDDEEGGGGTGPTASGGGGDTGDPGQAVVDYLAATNAADCTTAMSLLTEQSLAVVGGAGLPEAIGACEAELASGGEMMGTGVTVSGTEVVSNDGDTAVIAATVTVDESTETTEVTLRNEDGVWKVDLTAMTAEASAPMEAPPPPP